MKNARCVNSQRAFLFRLGTGYFSDKQREIIRYSFDFCRKQVPRTFRQDEAGKHFYRCQINSLYSVSISKSSVNRATG